MRIPYFRNIFTTLPTGEVYRNESSIINWGDAERPGTHWAYAKQEDRADHFTSSSSIAFFMFELKNCVEHVYFELCQYVNGMSEEINFLRQKLYFQ